MFTWEKCFTHFKSLKTYVMPYTCLEVKEKKRPNIKNREAPYFKNCVRLPVTSIGVCDTSKTKTGLKWPTASKYAKVSL